MEVHPYEKEVAAQAGTKKSREERDDRILPSK
jgi:hypothetical protein